MEQTRIKKLIKRSQLKDLIFELNVRREHEERPAQRHQLLARIWEAKDELKEIPPATFSEQLGVLWYKFEKWFDHTLGEAFTHPRKRERREKYMKDKYS